MTIAFFGKVTPVQMGMLKLAGHVLPGDEDPYVARTDDEFEKTVKEGHKFLVMMTEKDLGYDLKAWHEWLLGEEKSGYTHAYAWKGVRPAIEDAIKDPNRLRIAETLQLKSKS